MPTSRYERMRTDPANWKLGLAYHCRGDPRLPVGWTWNFAHPLVLPAIAAAVAGLPAPALLLWWLGVRSAIVMWLVVLLALAAIVAVASRLAREPGTRAVRRAPRYH